MRHAARAFLCLLALPLAGCVTGGAFGDAPEPAGILALEGGLVGRVKDFDLSDDAVRVGLDAEYQALQFGQVGRPISWTSGRYRGEVVPTQLYRIGSQDCRGYTHDVSRGTKTVHEVGSACRTGNAIWTPV